MGYYEFPHTRNYDTDLGYLIKRYFELSTDFESLEKNFDDLKAWCIAQLNSEALKTLVANKLDEWLQDGTLEALINNPLNHVTTYDTIVEMMTHSALLEGSKIYCSGADTVNDGNGGHFRIRARLSTDVIDNYNLYLIDGGIKVAERLSTEINQSIIFDNNKILIYGDSISVVENNYWTFLQKYHPTATFTNRAEAGTVISNAYQDIVEKQDMANFDIIFLAYGTNNWQSNTSISDIIVGTQNTIKEILKQNPSAQIIYIAPPFGYNKQLFTTDGIYNNLGLSTADYSEELEKACSYLSVPVINLSKQVTINTQNFKSLLLNDSGTDLIYLHPNITGSELIAKIVDNLSFNNKINSSLYFLEHNNEIKLICHRDNDLVTLMSYNNPTLGSLHQKVLPPRYRPLFGAVVVPVYEFTSNSVATMIIQTNGNIEFYNYNSLNNIVGFSISYPVTPQQLLN